LDMNPVDSLKNFVVVISGNVSVKIHIDEILTKCMSSPLYVTSD